MKDADTIARLQIEICAWQSASQCRTPDALAKMLADDRMELLRVRRDAAVAWDRCVELERAMKAK